ncbi:glycoside hydrolase family 13 protein [Pseudonocardia sp. TRM90224]|uniref:glycoside hydrolase family 13 protein n=1 Tax=Pseudonocardia sp. TRM90224 TaxID=2812678 RepID=UPI001E344E90|nr:glycoside hydrolase family 13 protein [Pseudonocardia sp. TRM90224]
MSDSWWRQAVVYQIYPRSFADANGDGIGDLRGITSRVEHLRDLGVDAVWLSPFYPSALADGGYDVDDYRDVDPKLGTLADFDEMQAALHAAGIKLIVDIVPNHSSNRHEWFRAALAAGPGSPERERYVFRRGGGPNGEEPPSDWVGYFGGPTWEPVGDGDWYLHLFAPEQPDFNWANDEVRADFLRTLRFWSDRGVDGFRVDVATALVKDMSLPLPTQAELDAEDVVPGTHRLHDRDELSEVYAEWRAVFDSYDPPRMAVAEAWVPADRIKRYTSPDSLGQAFNFDLLQAQWDAAAFRAIIEEHRRLDLASGSSSTWVLSNHDVIRHRSRYGLPPGTDETAWLRSGGQDPAPDLERGLRRARAATLLLLALPGSTYLYQGEELGLPEVADIPVGARQDPVWAISGGDVKGRDGCRVPLPWEATGPSFGFGAGPAHLPQPGWFAGLAVATQSDDEESTLSFYREAIRARRRLQTAESVEITDSAGDDGDTVLQFARPNGWTSITNFGTEAVELPAGRVVISSGPVEDGKLPGETTVWLVAAEG